MTHRSFWWIVVAFLVVLVAIAGWDTLFQVRMGILESVTDGAFSLTPVAPSGDAFDDRIIVEMKVSYSTRRLPWYSRWLAPKTVFVDRFTLVPQSVLSSYSVVINNQNVEVFPDRREGVFFGGSLGTVEKLGDDEEIVIKTSVSESRGRSLANASRMTLDVPVFYYFRTPELRDSHYHICNVQLKSVIDFDQQLGKISTVE